MILQAETLKATIEIGYFDTVEEATIASQSDIDSDNPVICIYGTVEYVWDETIVATN